MPCVDVWTKYERSYMYVHACACIHVCMHVYMGCVGMGVYVWKGARTRLHAHVLQQAYITCFPITMAPSGEDNTHVCLLVWVTSMTDASTLHLQLNAHMLKDTRTTIAETSLEDSPSSNNLHSNNFSHVIRSEICPSHLLNFCPNLDIKCFINIFYHPYKLNQP